MFRIILLILVFLFLFQPAWIFADSCERDGIYLYPGSKLSPSLARDDVYYCITNYAVDNDIVYLGEGTADWTTSDPITWEDKNIKIIGEGIGNTTIINPGFNIYNNTPGKASWEIGFFSVTQTGNTQSPFKLWGVGSTWTKGWRIHHIRDDVTGTNNQSSFWNWGGVTFGLIDNCTITYNPSQSLPAFNAIVISPFMPGEYGSSPEWMGHYDHSLGLNWFGTDNAIYVEDCTFIHSPSYISGLVNISYGGRIVFRNNDCSNSYFQTHGANGDSAENERRGGTSFEIYNNDFRNCYGRFTDIKSGTGLIFNNLIPTDGSVGFCDERAARANDEVCDGTKSYDGNYGDTAAPGWPCLDQPGWDFAIPGAPTSFPVYMWGNTPAPSITYDYPASAPWIKNTTHSGATGNGVGAIDYCDAGTGSQPASCGIHTLVYTPLGTHPLRNEPSPGSSPGSSIQAGPGNSVLWSN